MKSWILGLLIAVFLGALSTGVMPYAPTCMAKDQPEVTTDSGVRLIEFQNAQDWGFRAEWFKDFDCESTSFIYNEDAESTVTDGEIDTSFIYDKGNILVGIDTFGTGTLTVRIEGKTSGSSAWALITQATYTAVTAIRDSFPITSYWNKVRTGIKMDGVGSVENIDIDGEFVTQKKQ